MGNTSASWTKATFQIWVFTSFSLLRHAVLMRIFEYRAKGMRSLRLLGAAAFLYPLPISGWHEILLVYEHAMPQFQHDHRKNLFRKTTLRLIVRDQFFNLSAFKVAPLQSFLIE
jgi:hypothetical protein